jgi:hypothetical protein
VNVDWEMAKKAASVEEDEKSLVLVGAGSLRLVSLSAR